MSIGCHAEIYEGPDEFADRPPRRGLILCRDDDTSGGVEMAAAAISRLGIWLPIVGTAYEPDPVAVVQAMKQGALGFVGLPLRRAQLLETLQAVQKEVERSGAERQRAVDARMRMDCLTAREREVLDLLTEGSSNKGIARELGISPRTVEIHRANMMHKLGASHAAEAVRCRIEATMAGPGIGSRN
ncbi:response regulator transcription factor [Qipengyuania spongiae]|uniref:LuxR C-terminal-related transcriptional regulator n=1 Tax=Qipengyuania spongiae TaxID=2909673 RepID=A0ABY5T5Q8_9SPHN|nr:LuxR C-terminal-related transcriptional regulator [Qipengyuania spongiae]UVI40671.1 LuxR C-terminal-related transcriptional regulator [Qipengyuania spongiae]